MEVFLSKRQYNKYLKSGVSALAMVAVMTVGVQAAEEDAAKDTAKVEAELDDEGEVDEVVVTGSRIRRTEFTSASPIQIISGEISREIGLFDATDMLQSSVQSTGMQIDNTLNGFVLDNGAGATSVSFRGLGASRTLVLVNGRRMASSGVGGAPVSPDLNLIPSIMIERIEALFDGASAVYGSDAVAGVANVIMRKDIDGLEVEGTIEAPFSGGGEIYNVGAMWGKTWDNASFAISGEFYKRSTAAFKDRKFVNKCNEYYYQTNEGKIRRNAGGWWPRANQTNCKISGLINRIQEGIGYLGSIYYKPNGETNIGVPGFNEASLPWWGQYYPGTVQYDSNGNGQIDPRSDSVYFDANGDGLGDVDYLDPFYNSSDTQRAYNADFLSGIERYSIFSNGEYTFDDANDTTVFFEAMFSSRSMKIDNGPYQLFPWVAESNPTNPCGSNFGGPGQGQGCLVYFGLNGVTSRSRPIVSIIGDRNVNNVKVSNFRAVTGVKGQIPFIKESDWRYEAYMSYSRSKGTERSEGIIADKLFNSLDTTRWDPNNPGQMICGDGTDGCVVVDMYAPSIFQEGGGNFATQAERDYVFGTRFFETIIEQKMGGLTVDGNLFTLPWNDTQVPLVIGYEYRQDSIVSNPNDVAAKGLFIHWFTDEGADGTSNFNEIFAETQMELVRGKPMVEELTLSGAIRYTNPSFYDGAITYNIKGVYRPVDWFTFRGTYGTSYRAPNLREQFLNGTTGFLSVVDPCVVPEDARDTLIGQTPTYNAANDSRQPNVLAACSAQGLDPTTLGLSPDINALSSTEVVTGGASDVSEETSRSFTYGIVIDQPWFEEFDLQFSATYYDIRITNSIEEPGTGTILNKCYDNLVEPNATSSFCNRVSRDSTGKLILLDTSFINIGRITSKGVDLNMLYRQDFEVAAKNLGVTVDIKASYMKENIYEVEEDSTDFAGYPTNPRWRVQGRFAFEYDDFRLTWFTRWIQGGANPETNFVEGGSAGRPCFSTTDSVSCRPVFFTKNYVVHDVALTWRPGDYAVTLGIGNVFDRSPEVIDTSGVFGVRNFPYGVGYDLNGRSVYLTAKKKF
ncbi:MAG: TonB-dependent receptor [Alphaproteobacteria bacterium]|nr:TonB-dependent receptor [Alphaproteobacteria bacterium]